MLTEIKERKGRIKIQERLLNYSATHTATRTINFFEKFIYGLYSRVA